MSDISASQNNNKSIPFTIRFFATGFFSGYSPIAPGTCGSIVGILIYAVPGFESPLIIITMSIFFFLIGVYVSSVMENKLGDDPSIVVIDEIVGMWISLIFLPKSLTVILIAFFFFRAYDIFKPQPARYVEKYKNGWGIMLDDVVAGIYANISGQILLLSFPLLLK
ncbi:MAG: phosphatidylglycerophosphatase A [Bacteroidota bacterium]|nr:phosphatidylglycerophosphatase A [Bacteroidota bacterium]